jgi:hypothetical protein
MNIRLYSRSDPAPRRSLRCLARCRWTVVACLAAGAFGPWGCASAHDLAAERHAKAVQALLDLGAEVRDVDDEIAHERGTFVSLFREHFTHEGHIEEQVLALIRDIQACFLGLNNTPISDEGLSPLTRLSDLRLVNLYNTRITDQGLVVLARSQYVRLLTLNWTRITDHGLVALESMPSLRMLYLGDTSITDQGLTHLAKLSQLEALKFTRLPVTDDGLKLLATMPRLRFLGLNETHVTDSGLTHLDGLPKLGYLDVQGTVISESAIEEFQKRHPNCHVVR